MERPPDEIHRFRPVIFNNLKGWIEQIVTQPGQIQFDIRLDRSVSEFDIDQADLLWVHDSTVRFTVYDYANTSDEDDDSLNTSVPFQVA